MNPTLFIPPMLVGLLLSACAHQPKPTVSAPAASTEQVQNPPPHIAAHKENTSEHTPGLLEFISNFSELPLDAQKKELAQTLQKISIHHDELHQKTKAAIIYAVPGSKLRDPLKAQPLLEELAREKRLSKEENAIVAILREHAAETGKLNQRIREEQRRSEESQQKTNSLQQKLDELKKIERTMMQKSLKDPNRSSSK
ncbi:hypothetical protein LG198_13425 [Methylobacillus arboreus]|uniref:hypothetical protein n=1 Tax=Methylobacillus arboreus TaxID=755170 RepID=UPI001E563082|nr:hypothetical protein [Methylobacillus arboreus]MCB5191734.1 hypothetical protein [Methylobacillus arboreus]